ncbi:hypothetical protein FGO68_gene1734 [Halteria grandinella]|uniref:Uncharacterized protein n=1 Tax=Halteria grandinella TaxID=5974 RepID=A0A8J8T3I5_HALGN|nr:hypothetical protein FGO68_gene1734 [Halteria grandinella]
MFQYLSGYKRLDIDLMSSSDDDDQLIPKCLLEKRKDFVQPKVKPFIGDYQECEEEPVDLKNFRLQDIVEQALRGLGEGERYRNVFKDSLSMVEDSNEVIELVEKVTNKIKDTVKIAHQRCKKMLQEAEEKILGWVNDRVSERDVENTFIKAQSRLIEWREIINGYRENLQIIDSMKTLKVEQSNTPFFMRKRHIKGNEVVQRETPTYNLRCVSYSIQDQSLEQIPVMQIDSILGPTETGVFALVGKGETSFYQYTQSNQR